MSVSTARQQVGGLKEFTSQSSVKRLNIDGWYIKINFSNFQDRIEAIFAFVVGYLKFYDSIDTLSLPVLLG